jgi:4-amino-4-deoxy-L-arabinose transferase-like glycosyltransferase
VRMAFIALANQSALTFHSGGSDAPSYVLLAQNLLARIGFTYAGLPSAVRPPGYPVLLATFMLIFGNRYILGIRCLQFALGIATVALCAATAWHLFGDRAARATLLIGLFLPTLIFTTAQILTECLAAFLTTVFLRSLILQYARKDARSAWSMGWAAGIATMIRFNAAALPLFAGMAIWKSMGRSGVKNLAIALGIPLLIVLPWLIRNEIAFHGEVLYSTQGGPNAVQGVLTTEGRTQPGDSETLRKNLGWELRQIETNDSSRRLLPSEAALDRRAIVMVPGLWERQRWHVFPLVLRKLADFWLSRDQWAGTTSLATADRVIRSGGVLAYWAVLFLGILGWRALRRTNEPVAVLLLIYAAGFTLLHLPLVMNTRLRIPLLEPLFVILAGAGWKSLSQTWTSPWALHDSAIDPAAEISIGPRALPVSDAR